MRSDVGTWRFLGLVPGLKRSIEVIVSKHNGPNKSM